MCPACTSRRFVINFSARFFRGGDGMAGGWMGVGAGFDGLVRRWRRSAGRPHAAGGRRYAARTHSVLHRHLLYARARAAQRARHRRRTVPAARHRHRRRFVQVTRLFIINRWHCNSLLRCYLNPLTYPTGREWERELNLKKICLVFKYSSVLIGKKESKKSTSLNGVRSKSLISHIKLKTFLSVLYFTFKNCSIACLTFARKNLKDGNLWKWHDEKKKIWPGGEGRFSSLIEKICHEP